MVDAQGAAARGGIANRLRKHPIPVAPVLLAVGGWKSPVLAAGRELIGWRADPAYAGKEPAVCPQIGAEIIGGERPGVIETNAHSPIERVGVSLSGLLRDLPLQEFEKPHALTLLVREIANRPRAGIAVFRRPVRPHPHGR